MFKTAFRFARGKKKQTIWLWLVIMLSMALILSIVPMFDAARENIFQMYAGKYGEHRGILWELTEERRQAISENAIVTRAGYITNYGLWETGKQSNTIALGAMDETAISLGHIRLLEGEFPQAEDEIVIERLALFQLPGEPTLGDTVTFTQNGHEKAFRVVGILADYSAQWDLGGSAVMGKTTLPQALVCAQQMTPYETCMGALIYTDTKIVMINNLRTEIYGQVFKEDADGQIQQYDRWGVRYDPYGNDAVNNWLLYDRVYHEVLEPFDQFKQIFSIIIIIGTCLTMYTTIVLYIQNCRPAYEKLYILGASNRQALTVFLLQCGCVIFSTLPVAAGMAALLAVLGNAISGGVPINVFTQGNLYYPCIVLASILLCMAVVFRALIFPLAQRDLSKMSKEKPHRRQTPTKRITWFMARTFLHSNGKRVIAILIVAGMLVSAFCVAQTYITQINKQDPTKADFSVQMDDLTATGIPPFMVSNYQKTLFSPDDVEALGEMPGVQIVQRHTHTAMANILLDGEPDLYWAQLCNPELEPREDGFDVQTLFGKQYGTYRLAEISEIVVIDKSNEAFYQEVMPDLPIDQLKQNYGVAIYMPTRYTEDGTELENTTFAAGEDLVFARITYDMDRTAFDKLIQNPEALQYEEISLPILHASQTGGYTQVLSNEAYYVQAKRPVIYITKETAQQSGLVLGYQNVSLRMTEEISEQEYEAVYRAFMEMSLSVPGAIIYCERDEQKQDRDLIQVVNASLFVLLLVFGGFVVLSVYATLYMTIIRKKKTLAVYRALGISRRRMQNALRTELMVYWLMLMIITAGISIFLFGRLWDYSQLKEYLEILLRIWGIAAVVEGLAFCLMSVVLPHSIYKDSVYTAMRFSE